MDTKTESISLGDIPSSVSTGRCGVCPFDIKETVEMGDGSIKDSSSVIVTNKEEAGKTTNSNSANY